MASSIVHALVFCFVAGVLLCGGRAHHNRDQSATVHDVTEYGAAPGNGDSTAAFLSAWRAACDSTSGHATLRIPRGTFAVGAVEFQGPCVNGGAPAVVIEGVLQPCAFHRSDDAWITFRGLNGLLVTGDGTLDGQGDRRSGGKSNKSKTTSLVLEDVTNSTVRGLRLVNSRGFHVNLRRCSRVAAEGLGIHAPADSRNTDGIHVGLSSHVRILDSVIGTGDDCVSVGPGSTDVVVSGVVCGPGHGLRSIDRSRRQSAEDLLIGRARRERETETHMPACCVAFCSVGSLGKGGGEADVVGLVVKNCTVKGTTNGVRIKTWPGSPPSRASNITFQDIAVVNVSRPIVIDQRYCPHGHCSDADKPSLVQISDVTFQRIEGTSSSRMAVQLLCSEDRPCTGVLLDGINLTCGHHPCRSHFSNVQGTPAASVVAIPAPRREEEAADVGSTQR
ncbi:hypothetical protein U9M48_037921 [Paspalum notatum var. saurae]|uniref:Polygalacturonase n=1 Tax=Paspalum notatum var. saurae TaxID=547442 RepID=A0AAQ3XB60_PASNO